MKIRIKKIATLAIAILISLNCNAQKLKISDSSLSKNRVLKTGTFRVTQRYLDTLGISYRTYKQIKKYYCEYCSYKWIEESGNEYFGSRDNESWIKLDSNYAKQLYFRK